MGGALAGKTIFISGGSRGIGLAIAVRAAKDGANVALIAKTDEPHPQLPGTVHTAAEEIRAAGGQALPIVGDIRDQDAVLGAVAKAVDEFGGIDICINNASAINLANVETMPLKRYDLIQSINSRGTFVVSQACIPHLKANGGHILTLSPPINLNPRWLGAHAPYTLSKYGMTLLTLGMAEELSADGVAANCLWPETTIATAAVQNLLGGDEMIRRSRTPEIVADAAFEILRRDPSEASGQCFIDSEVLTEAGGYDLDSYAVEAGLDLYPDVFLD